MVREALRDRFVQVLTDAGGSAGNGRLLAELGWQEDTYQSVRDSLLEDGTVVVGRGRGGSVKLASLDQAQALSAPRAAAPSPAKSKPAKGNGAEALPAAKPSGGKLTQAELERHLWQAADILRGTVDAGDYKQYIFGLLFYKRLAHPYRRLHRVRG